MSTRRVAFAAWVFVVVCSLVAGAEYAELDTRNGFRDVRFGEPLSRGFKLVFEDQTRPWRVYERRSDNREIGTAKLLSINYYTFDGVAAGVALIASGGNCDALVESFTSVYGEPMEGSCGIDTGSPDMIPMFCWRGEIARAAFSRGEGVAAILGDDVCGLEIYSVVLRERRDEFVRDKAREDL